MRNRFKYFSYHLHFFWPLYIAAIICMLIIFGNNVLPKSNTPSNQVWLAAISLLTLYISLIQVKISNDNIYKDLSISFDKRFEEIDRNLSELKIKLGEDFSEKEEYKSYGKRYFDLCSDQFHWYKKNRIDPVTWNIWLESMRSYIKMSKLEELKKEEKDRDNLYYGLFTALEKSKEKNSETKQSPATQIDL